MSFRDGAAEPAAANAAARRALARGADEVELSLDALGQDTLEPVRPPDDEDSLADWTAPGEGGVALHSRPDLDAALCDLDLAQTHLSFSAGEAPGLSSPLPFGFERGQPAQQQCAADESRRVEQEGPGHAERLRREPAERCPHGERHRPGGARGAALRLCALAAAAVRTRGRFTLALSGGSTPWAMLEVFADQDVDWSHLHVFQVDERRAPDGDEVRNWTHLRRSLLNRVPIPAQNLHPMPVLDAGCAGYATVLAAVAGTPPRLDCVQLGLGDDGHTASLMPGDAVLEVQDRDVAWTGTEYRGHRRMTLTYPCLDRARNVLWLVAGRNKAEMVARLVRADPSMPAGRVRQDHAALIADAASTAGLRPS